MAAMTDDHTYVLDRDFDAAPNLVWRTFTEPELLARWYGPNVDTIIHKLDVRPGGVWLNEMRFGDRSNFERMDYLEVVEGARLVWLHSVADADWNVIANPHMPDWPRVLMTRVTLDAQGDDATRMRLTWTPHEASAAEIACFSQAMAGLDKGWGAGMALLAEVLAELQA